MGNCCLFANFYQVNVRPPPVPESPRVQVVDLETERTQQVSEKKKNRSNFPIKYIFLKEKGF